MAAAKKPNPFAKKPAAKAGAKKPMPGQKCPVCGKVM
jgi:ssDNA-binding Zn-finger/Zn-ribbon topoisomerase 1